MGSAKIVISGPNGTDSSATSFLYTRPTAVADPSWLFVGAPGFSATRAMEVKIKVGSDNLPYVSFRDSLGRAVVEKYSGSSWSVLGGPISGTGTLYVSLALDNNNAPVVAYADSMTGNITVQRYNGTQWQVLGSANFGKVFHSYTATIPMGVDANNNIYVLTGPTTSSLQVYRFNGTSWAGYGSTPAASGVS